jgi:hypothetical protein
MSNISKNKVAVVIAVLTVMLVATTIASSVDYRIFATKEKNQVGSHYQRVILYNVIKYNNITQLGDKSV